MKIEKNLKQMTKYTKEEKYKMFAEGLAKVPTPKASKKVYNRKKMKKIEY